MRLTLRHRFAFSRRFPAGFGTPEAWDELRKAEEGFALPADRGAWETAARNSGLEPRARAIAAVAEEIGARRVCSYGVGTALLEWNLQRVQPSLELTCTDFGPLTVARLAEHFHGALVVRHDLRVDPPLEADLHLFHRVDTELSDDEWPAVFGRFRQPVLVVATELLELRSLTREIATRVLHPHAVPAGWIRTEPALRALWSESHDDTRVELPDLPGYLLTPRVR